MSAAATGWRFWRATTAGSAIAEFGCARVGARIILLNSSFSGPQIKEVSEREDAKLMIYDDEYTKDVSKAEPPLGKLRP